MGIFVKDDQEIKVTIYVSSDIKGRTVAYGEGIILPEEIKLITDTPKKYEIFFKYPNYRDCTDIADRGFSFTEQGDMTLNTMQIRFKRLVKLLKRWDFVDDDGNPIPTSEEMISKLDPVVAAAIIFGLEKALGISPDEA